ncbi:MAG: hypothetical protein HFI67_06925 [Lachnospiraceae bacterium]|jgi:hypothetical protein|nr:hypothetical protein [Lachnospiraceae bacterium]
MRIRIGCLDQELLWAIDDVIGGLYSIDQKTFETECVVDCRKLFPHGKFGVLSLFKWKEDYIVIIPQELNRKWIFYNKVTEEIEYRKVIEKKCQEVLVAADQDRNQLYFFPLYVYDPILIMDLNTLTCAQTIENWSGRVPNDCRETAWKGIYDGQYLFFPIKNTRIVVRMDCETQKVNLLELDISQNVIDVDYAFGELWVLPVSGDRLYQIDENGRVVHSVVLSVENRTDSLPAFARIVVQRRYLFLLPYYRKGIYVCHKQNGTTQVIPKESSNSRKKNKEIYLRYWEYCVKGNQICFLPFRDSYIEIDLNTLAYRKRELFYPNSWSDEEKIWRIIWSHVSERDSIIREKDECNLKHFSEYLQHKTNKDDFSKSDHTGEKIWDAMKNRGRTI